jgi:hypothetical protein
MEEEKLIDELRLALQRSLPEREITALVHAQLSKDFSSCGIDPGFGPETPPGEWIALIGERIGNTDAATLSRLLCAVDIPDWKLRTINSGQALAASILYREYVKIRYRLSY